MTETEWLACHDPQPMLEFVRKTGSVRSLRLFSCGCLRLVHDLPWELGKAVDYTEKGVDCLLRNSEVVTRIRKLAFEMNIRDVHELPWSLIDVPIQSARSAFRYFCMRQPTGCSELVALFRCVFGNPFRPVVVDPVWLTSTVVDLAWANYVYRDFDRLSILADALEDAGCTDREILDHCRLPGPHVRGCWVVDLVLGKE